MAFKNWHHISKDRADSGERWTVIWDTTRITESDAHNKAVEQYESAALDRAKHLLRMGFIVYEIRDPAGAVFLAEDEIKRRVGAEPGSEAAAARLPPRDTHGVI